jgi:hypothetical protein
MSIKQIRPSLFSSCYSTSASKFRCLARMSLDHLAVPSGSVLVLSDFHLRFLELAIVAFPPNTVLIRIETYAGEKKCSPLGRILQRMKVDVANFGTTMRSSEPFQRTISSLHTDHLQPHHNLQQRCIITVSLKFSGGQLTYPAVFSRKERALADVRTTSLNTAKSVESCSDQVCILAGGTNTRIFLLPCGDTRLL